MQCAVVVNSRADQLEAA